MHGTLRGRIEIGLFLSIIVITVVLFVLFRTTATSFDEELVRSADFDVTTWAEYRSVAYDVSLRYPDRWELIVSEDPLGPMIRVVAPGSQADYPEETITSLQPQVTIFPKGIPPSFQSELPTTYTPFEQAVRASVRRQTPFLLGDGTRFGELHRYLRAPESWSPSGFVWSQGYVGDVSSACEARGPALSENERRCDLLFGDQVVYSGRVRAFDIDLVDAIVDSIRLYGSVQSEFATTSAANIIEPSPHAQLHSPVRVRGTAPASWFFEGEVPIRLFDANDMLLIESSAARTFEQGTPLESVSFTALIYFSAPQTRAGTLIIQKANPSGAPQLSDQVRIPVLF